MSRRAACLGAFALVLAAAPPIAACGGHACKLIAPPGVEVTVQTAAGAPICDAVVAVDGKDAVDQLESMARADGSCPYIGIYTPGTYTVRVVSNGVEERVADVHVTKGDCYLRLQRLTVTFPPST